jgi:hypothetical protein
MITQTPSAACFVSFPMKARAYIAFVPSFRWFLPPQNQILLSRSLLAEL